MSGPRRSWPPGSKGRRGSDCPRWGHLVEKSSPAPPERPASWWLSERQRKVLRSSVVADGLVVMYSCATRRKCLTHAVPRRRREESALKAWLYFTREKGVERHLGILWGEQGRSQENN
eukprot:scaffold1272_cov250-Pinguiococcus_pyrenoidosus.AAC.50